MSECYMGEIRLFAGYYVPQGWLACNGAVLPIQSNEALYSLLGTTYGGDGQTNFALPNLNFRVIIGAGASDGASPHKAVTTYNSGSNGGACQRTISASQMPAHSHGLMASTAAATSLSPSNAVLADPSDQTNFYVPVVAGAKRLPLGDTALSANGGGQPISNVMPCTTLIYIIAVNGIYPDFN